MALNYHPQPGTILLCDFSKGFQQPEMVKAKRPVIVLSPRLSARNDLVTVVACSTKPPSNPQPYHYCLPKAAMPQLGSFQNGDTWVKGDMIYTVGFHRLEMIRLGKRDNQGKRQYFKQRLGRDQMAQIYGCVLHGIGLSHIVHHI